MDIGIRIDGFDYNVIFRLGIISAQVQDFGFFLRNLKNNNNSKIIILWTDACTYTLKCFKWYDLFPL